MHCGNNLMNLIGVELLQCTKYSSNGDLGTNYRKTKDGDLFSKWSQCVNNSFNQYKLLEKISSGQSEENYYVAPILVVPDNTLFIAVHGSGQPELKPANCIPYKVGIKRPLGAGECEISCFYIVTISGLGQFVSALRDR